MRTESVAERHLRNPFASGNLAHTGQRGVLDLAHAGLTARNRLNPAGDNETGFLITLQETVETGITPADRKLQRFNEAWDGDIDPLFREFAY